MKPGSIYAAYLAAARTLSPIARVCPALGPPVALLVVPSVVPGVERAAAPRVVPPRGPPAGARVVPLMVLAAIRVRRAARGLSFRFHLPTLSVVYKESRILDKQSLALEVLLLEVSNPCFTYHSEQSIS